MDMVDLMVKAADKVEQVKVPTRKLIKLLIQY